MAIHKYGSTNEALLALAEGLVTGAKNPNIFNYKPHAKQEIFHRSTKTAKLYIGGNRSGKTTGGVVEDIWWATCTHPYRADVNQMGAKRMRVVAVDFVNGVEKIIFPQFKQWLYPSALRGGSWEAAYDKFLRTLYFDNGSFIEFMSYDQDLDKFAGTSRHYVHFDEEPPRPIWVENLARLADINGTYAITMTPVEGMTWVYDEIYEPNVEGEATDAEVVQVSSRENPYISKAGFDAFLKSIATDEDEVAMREEGTFIQVGGRVYKNFDHNKGGVHVLSDPIDDIRDFCRGKMIGVSLDHGLNNPTAVLWHAVDTSGQIVTFHEHYKQEWSVAQHAQEILRINKMLGINPDFYIADPSIKNRDPITLTSIHEEYTKFGIAFVLGNNDVPAGIIRVKRYMQPRKIRGKRGEPSKVRPKWQVTPNCDKLIWELKKYRWKTYAQKKLNYENNNYELPHKKDDHACDSLRYFIMSRPDLHHEPDREEGKQSDDIVSELHLPEAISPTSERIADPYARESQPGGVSEWASPTVATDWDYDEHLGGIY
jgi:phage terminase large subunit-like protein